MKRHVALIIETSSIYGRDLLAGIVRYMRMHDQWSVFLEQRDLFKQPPAWLDDWHGHGIISRATTSRLIDAISKTGVPFVELTDRKVLRCCHRCVPMMQRSDEWVPSICWNEALSVLVSVGTKVRRGRSVAKMHSSGWFRRNHRSRVHYIIPLGRVGLHETGKTSSSVL